MLSVTKAELQKLCPRPKTGYKAEVWDWYADAFEQHSADLFAEFGIDQLPELHDFIAQVAHESGGFTIVEESLNYTTPARILEIFGVGRHSAKITEAEAQQLAGKPEALAERVYGLGNPKKAAELGNIEPGDGWKFKGWGAMQITGRADHEKYFDGTYDGETCLRAALMEYTAKGCPKYAMACDIVKTTKLINGGTNGLAERKKLLAKAQAIWTEAPVDAIAMGLVDTKSATASNTMRGAGTTSLAGGFVAVEQIRAGVAAATQSGRWDWFAFIDKTFMNEQFWVGFIIIASSLLVLRERWKKGDLSLLGQ